MKSHLLLASIVIAVIWTATSTMNAQTGCPGQDPYNCNGCTQDSVYRFRVCIGPVTDTIDVTICTQFATNQYISNPCRNCVLPLDAISWVRKVCVPPALYLVSIDSIYRAILKATSLCCSNQFIPATIRSCDPGPDPCSFTSNAYCHVLGLPNCVKREGNCWIPCESNCDKMCYVERRYCRKIVGNIVQCLECITTICATNNQCEQPCTLVNCANLNTPLGCCSGD